jgi:hypothetical protein
VPKEAAVRVRILSGNEAGIEREVGLAEGEQMCQFGFAELAPVVAPSSLPSTGVATIAAPAAPTPVLPPDEDGLDSLPEGWPAEASPPV